MGSIIALVIIILLSLFIVRVGSTALMMTGLSWDSASFQAYSAFFGVGFTTREAELVVNHPFRRRIIRDLILAGNVGLTSALATIIVTFLQKNDSSATLTTIGLVAITVITILLLGKIEIIQRVLDRSIRMGLEKLGKIHVMDYELVLRAQSGFCVSELDISEDHFLSGKELGESRPADHGIIVLGITKTDHNFIGAPDRHHIIEAGDSLLIYGHEKNLKKLSLKKP